MLIHFCFVAQIIVLRKLGLIGNFKMAFFTDNVKDGFGHINDHW